MILASLIIGSQKDGTTLSMHERDGGWASHGALYLISALRLKVRLVVGPVQGSSPMSFSSMKDGPDGHIGNWKLDGWITGGWYNSLNAPPQQKGTEDGPHMELST